MTTVGDLMDDFQERQDGGLTPGGSCRQAPEPKPPAAVSHHIDTSDGTWREVSPNEWASNTDRDSLRVVGTGGGLRHWLRDAVPPLPTEQYTVIKALWEPAGEYRMILDGESWYFVGTDDRLMPETLAAKIRGWEPLSEPRAVSLERMVERDMQVRKATAKTVLDRVDYHQHGRTDATQAVRAEFEMGKSD